MFLFGGCCDCKGIHDSHIVVVVFFFYVFVLVLRFPFYAIFDYTTIFHISHFAVAIVFFVFRQLVANFAHKFDANFDSFGYHVLRPNFM